MTFEQIKTIITDWKLNRTEIARRSGINYYTFTMKYKQRPNYRFTEEELIKISNVLLKLSNDIGGKHILFMNKNN